VLVAPSGAGKTTMARSLVEGPGPFTFSVSATTRAARPGEIDGDDYHFVTEAEFLDMVERGDLAEWARVHDRYYGTLLRTLEDARRRGEQVVLDIDVQGAFQILERVPDALLIFILPPSGTTLMRRLLGRGTEDPAEIRRRMDTAREELAAARRFSHFVVNDDLDTAVDEVRAIARGDASGSLPGTSLETTLDRIWSEIVGELGASSDGSETL
jgi:guanylate kinase